MLFTGLKSRVGRTLFLLEAPGERLFPHLFQLLEAACIPWLCGTSIFKTSDSLLRVPYRSLDAFAPNSTFNPGLSGQAQSNLTKVSRLATLIPSGNLSSLLFVS